MPASLPPSLLGTSLPHIQVAGCIYMDYNGTTPIFPEVCHMMGGWEEGWAMQPQGLGHAGRREEGRRERP